MSAAATALLNQLRALDVHVRAEDGRLRINAPQGRLTPELQAQLVASKDMLLRVLSGETQAAQRVAAPVLAPVPRTGTLRLSYLQERLWVLDQLQPGYTAYNLATSSGIISDLDIPRLMQAARRVIARHEILHSRFVTTGGAPSVQIAAADLTPVDVRDLRSLSSDEQARIVAAAASSAAHDVFDLANQAPVRFTVLQTGETAGALIFSAHHIALDSWSMGLLMRELTAEYEGALQGAQVRAPEPLQYLDFAQWQREVMEGPGAQVRLKYWTDKLSALPQLSTFPADHPRPLDVAGTGTAYDFAWDPTLYEGVRAMARDLDATLYMILLAAVAAVVGRNSGQTDVAIGSPVGTRERSELETMIGPIVNPLVLRFDLSDDPTFAALVTRARDAVLDGHANQDVPFESLVQQLNPERSLGHSPLFQVAVVLHSAPDGAAATIVGGGAIYDVTLFAAEHHGMLTGALEYRSDLYDEATIVRIESQIRSLLTAAVAQHGQRLSAMPLLTPAESTRLLDEFNPAPVAVDSASVVTQFARMVASHGSRDAVVASDATLSYAELDRRSTLVAQALRAAGAGRGSFVALATDRSSAMVVAALGILKSGAAYVPVDVSYPMDRVAFMLRDSGTQHMVTTRAALESLQGVPLPGTVVIADELPDVAPVSQELRRPDEGAEADVAYLIYTSGSTGTPKGVMVPHRALSNFLGAMRERPGLTANDGVLCVTSMSFDISVLEVFLPLVTGARTIVASRDDAGDGLRLAELIRKTDATMVQSTPSGWRLLMTAKWEGGPAITAIAGGEPMPADLTAWLGARVARLWNGYGPTETTVYSTMALLTGSPEITIGTPVANTRIYVLAAGGMLSPIGAPGEICIGGAGVTAGYINRADLTSERFVPDPFVPGGTMYRSGDIGRWRPDGRLEHMGRIDGQVKVRGYRIETGEIETALMDHAMVRLAVVGVKHASADDARLVAWVQLEEDDSCTASELRRHLRQRLPEFMIPSMLMLVDSFPLTPNAKIDKRALPDPFAGARNAPHEYVPPVTESERMISEIWTRLLNVPNAGVTDSFFELGGHSLLAMRAATEISERSGRVIEPRLLFFRTLGQLAEACDGSAPPAPRS